MSKKITIATATTLMLFQTCVFAADRLTKLDEQRDDLLKEITSGLVAGKIGPTDAQQLKAGLDNVMQLETRAQEDKNVTDAEYQTVSDALSQVQTQTAASEHPKKVWMGISNKSTAQIRDKISNALDTRKISKEQADSLMDEEEKLRQRVSNGSPTSEYEYTDAISISQDLLALDGKIDQIASAGHPE